VLQVFHRLAKHLGACANHLLQVLLVIVTLLQGLAVLESAVHGGHEVLPFKRLQQVVVGPAPHRIDGHADVVNGADHNHRNVGQFAADTVEKKDPVSVLHHDVGENQVEGVVFEDLQGLAAARRKLHIVPAALERRANHRAHMILVVNDQMRAGLRARARTPAFWSAGHCIAAPAPPLL
jgi:hypothetical protein